MFIAVSYFYAFLSRLFMAFIKSFKQYPRLCWHLSYLSLNLLCRMFLFSEKDISSREIFFHALHEKTLILNEKQRKPLCLFFGIVDIRKKSIGLVLCVGIRWIFRFQNKNNHNKLTWSIFWDGITAPWRRQVELKSLQLSFKKFNNVEQHHEIVAVGLNFLRTQPVLKNSSDLNIRNCRFSSLLLRQNRSKPLRFCRRFDRFSSVFKRKNRRIMRF